MSSEVKRFVVDMQRRGEECVLASDYDALETENARLRQEMQGMVKALTDAVEYLNSNYLNSIRAGSMLHISMRCALPALNAKQGIERLASKTTVTMGVSNGAGQLFVHGDYDSIKAAQEIILERDQLRHQLAKRDAEILEQCRLNGMGAERELKLIAQRDKLAVLLRKVLATHDYHTDDGEQAADEAHAALAEVK